MTPCSLMLLRSRGSIMSVSLLLQSTAKERKHPHKRHVVGVSASWRNYREPQCNVKNRPALKWGHLPLAERPARGTFCCPPHSSAASTLTWQLLSFVSVHSLKTLYGLQLWAEDFSLVNEYSQLNVILQHFLCDASFSSFYSFGQILENTLSGG